MRPLQKASAGSNTSRSQQKIQSGLNKMNMVSQAGPLSKCQLFAHMQRFRLNSNSIWSWLELIGRNLNRILRMSQLMLYLLLLAGSHISYTKPLKEKKPCNQLDTPTDKAPEIVVPGSNENPNSDKSPTESADKKPADKELGKDKKKEILAILSPIKPIERVKKTALEHAQTLLCDKDPINIHLYVPPVKSVSIILYLDPLMCTVWNYGKKKFQRNDDNINSVLLGIGGSLNILFRYQLQGVFETGYYTFNNDNTDSCVPGSYWKLGLDYVYDYSLDANLQCGGRYASCGDWHWCELVLGSELLFTKFPGLFLGGALCFRYLLNNPSHKMLSGYGSVEKKHKFDITIWMGYRYSFLEKPLRDWN